VETIWAPNLEQLEKYLFLKVKAPQNSTPENGHAHGECFWCFYSCTWWIKTLPQSPICIVSKLVFYAQSTGMVISGWSSLYRGDITLHSAYNIDYHYVLILELETPKCSMVECYMCWNVSWPASVDSLVKNWLSFSSNFTQSLWYVTASAPVFYFTAKWLGSF